MYFVGEIFSRAKNVGHDICSLENARLSLEPLFYYWREYLFDKCMRIFEWDGLPFDAKEMEQRLILTGHAFVYQRPNENIEVYFSQLADFTGVYFDEPLSVNTYSPKWSDNIKTEDGVLVNANGVRLALYPLIHKYASLLAHTELSLQQAVIDVRENGGIPVASTEKEKQAYATYRNGKVQGKIGAILDPAFATLKFMETGKNVKNSILELWDLEKELLASFYHDLGLKTASVKKANVLTPEQNADEGLLLFNIDDMLSHREDGAKRISEKYGLNVSVKVNEKLLLSINNLRDAQAENGGVDDEESNNNV